MSTDDNEDPLEGIRDFRDQEVYEDLVNTISSVSTVACWK